MKSKSRNFNTLTVMKRLSLFCLVLVFAISTSCGQGGKKQNAGKTQDQQAPQMQEQRRGPGGQEGRGQFNPEDMAKRQTSQIAEFVKFTEGQEAKVTEINLKYAKLMTESRGQVNFREMSETQRTEWRAKSEKQQKDKESEFKALFNADQYKQYETYKQEQEKRRKERMQQPRP